MGNVENPAELIVAALGEQQQAAEVLAGLKDIAELMAPGSSILIAVIGHGWVGHMVDVLEKEEAEIVRQELKDEVA